MTEAVMAADIDRALAILAEGRGSHVLWRDHLAATHVNGLSCKTAPITDGTGSAAHNNEWVRKYDHVIRVVRERS